MQRYDGCAVFLNQCCLRDLVPTYVAYWYMARFEGNEQGVIDVS